MDIFKRGYFNASSKHIKMRFDFCQETLNDAVAVLEYVQSEDMVTDPFAKPNTNNFTVWRARLRNMAQVDVAMLLLNWDMSGCAYA